MTNPRKTIQILFLGRIFPLSDNRQKRKIKVGIYRIKGTKKIQNCGGCSGQQVKPSKNGISNGVLMVSEATTLPIDNKEANSVSRQKSTALMICSLFSFFAPKVISIPILLTIVTLYRKRLRITSKCISRRQEIDRKVIVLMFLCALHLTK